MKQAVTRRDFSECLGRYGSILAHAVLAAFLLLQTAGCGDAPKADDDASPAALPDGADASANGNVIDDTWIALYIGADKVGYQHTQQRSIERDGQPRIEIDRKQVINALRYQGLSEIRITTHVVETPDERLVRFESSADRGSGETQVTGRVEGDRLQIETRSGGGSRLESMPWEDAPGGVLAWENSLTADPLELGEQRSIKTLELDLGRPQIVEVDLYAERREETALPDGPRSLLRLQVKTRFPGQPVTIDMTAWCDERGKVLKTEIPYSDRSLTAYVVTRQAALAEGKPLEFDIGLAATVKVERQLEHPHATRRIVYEASLPEGDPSAAFLTTAGQAVEKIDEHTARITVTAVQPAAGPAPPAALSAPGDLAPNSMIESDAPEVIAMARSTAPAEREPWKLAVALEKLVHDEVQNKNFSTALATAAQTARSRQGDCTEHAMLLAALCRARKIPARVAIGLVYIDPPGKPAQRGFAYHMWTEVAINGEWIPIDATLGQGGVGAAHLTLVETNFAEAGIDAFLPVLNVIGKLKLKIVDVK